MVPEFFCLSDASLIGFLNTSNDLKKEINTLVDLAETIIDSNQNVLTPSTIDSVDIGKNLFFYDLYSAEFDQSDKWNGIDRDTLERFLLLRRRLETIDSAPSVAQLCNLSGQCIWAQSASGAASVAQAMAAETSYFAWLLIGPNGGDFGEYSLRFSNGADTRIYALRSSKELPLYARWLIKEFAQVEDDFFFLWERAFPSILKSDDLSFRRFQGTYINLRDDVTKHLAFLNDHFESLWNECNMDFAIFKARAKSAFDVDFSNESTQTRNSSKKMNERNAAFNGMIVRCELHTKIQPTVNRIHFHPPKSEIGGSKILVGIFVNHLST